MNRQTRIRWAAWVACGVGVLSVAIWFWPAHEGPDAPRDFSKLDLRAPGCKITGPDGKPLVLGTGTVKIPKGTTVTGKCFPAQAAKQPA